ncbi:hypothetical protein GCM10017673_36980 [Streptosporangium violaceochromogenes]|nr:hypothetical protein GCM10017673_36980 [Streptosporangium violaceochromogenes]
MPPSFAESLARAADVLERVRRWELPEHSWQAVDDALAELEHAVAGGDAHRVLLTVSRIELSGVIRGASPMVGGRSAEERGIPGPVDKAVTRIGVVVEQAREGGERRRD